MTDVIDTVCNVCIVSKSGAGALPVGISWGSVRGGLRSGKEETSMCTGLLLAIDRDKQT